MYKGGSDRDELLISETGNSAPSLLKSSGNQMFIIFTSNSNGVGKGFTAKILFGNIPIHYIGISISLISFLLIL